MFGYVLIKENIMGNDIEKKVNNFSYENMCKTMECCFLLKLAFLIISSILLASGRLTGGTWQNSLVSSIISTGLFRILSFAIPIAICLSLNYSKLFSQIGKSSKYTLIITVFLLLFTNFSIGNKLGLSVAMQLAMVGLSGFFSVFAFNILIDKKIEFYLNKTLFVICFIALTLFLFTPYKGILAYVSVYFMIAQTHYIPQYKSVFHKVLIYTFALWNIFIDAGFLAKIPDIQILGNLAVFFTGVYLMYSYRHIIFNKEISLLLESYLLKIRKTFGKIEE